jgi:hypothetical protein
MGILRLPCLDESDSTPFVQPEPGEGGKRSQDSPKERRGILNLLGTRCSGAKRTVCVQRLNQVKSVQKRERCRRLFVDKLKIAFERKQQSSHALAQCASRRGENAELATGLQVMNAKLKYESFV